MVPNLPRLRLHVRQSVLGFLEVIKTSMWTNLRTTGAGILFGCVMLFIAGCATHEEAGYHSGPYASMYDYYYYPGYDVYYYPSGGVYYWYSSGRWASGPRLPRTIVVENAPRVNVQLNTARPYTQHTWVKQHYPPPPGH